MKTGGTDAINAVPKLTQSRRITWKRCCRSWWDAMRGNRYAGWSVAQQCRVRWVRNSPEQYDCGWYVFNDAINEMIGPFTKPEAARRSCPLMA
jgi:hypothetical protein